jgi:CDP-glucose 4,6-dehydratase
MHYLITGHTGFKGAWMSLLLKELGHEVSGISLEPIVDSIGDSNKFGAIFKNDIRLDIRNYNELKKSITEINPDYVVHLAAQSLVRESYITPNLTIETNVIGTYNVLNACHQIESVKNILIITSDKVYKNTLKKTGYVESDELGGNDPYSSSKAMADILTQSWAKNVLNKTCGIARAGNVIGGGDVSKDRLMPTLISSYQVGEKPKLRHPNFVRPWQHVLDCVFGYITLLDHQELKKESSEWNFGPPPEDFRKVSDVAKEVEKNFKFNIGWSEKNNDGMHEEEYLVLNSTKATRELGWLPRLNFEQGIRWTVEWQNRVINGADAIDACLFDIQKYLNLVNKNL